MFALAAFALRGRGVLAAGGCCCCSFAGAGAGAADGLEEGLGALFRDAFCELAAEGFVGGLEDVSLWLRGGWNWGGAGCDVKDEGYIKTRERELVDCRTKGERREAVGVEREWKARRGEGRGRDIE